jgi:hypothetical protein
MDSKNGFVSKGRGDQPLKGAARRPNSSGKLLFDDLPECRHSIYVTNMDLPVRSTLERLQ